MKVAIIGSRGFIGQHLTRHLLNETAHSLVLVNRTPAKVTGDHNRVVSRIADLTNSRSLTPTLEQADVVVNLAWPDDAAPSVWTAALAGALRSSGAKRLLHCSTAVVVGRSPDATIDETTVPRPVTAYERGKLEAETRLRDHLAGGTPLVIARPTVVFGAGGQNLVSLARALMRKQPVTDFARRALFGDRPMHLVPVGTVVRALVFLLDRDLPPHSVFQIAADDQPDNTYRGVERRLRIGLGLKEASSGIVLPPWILQTGLRLRGRSDTNPRRRYSAAALRACDFSGAEPVGAAIEDFGRWFARTASTSA